MLNKAKLEQARQELQKAWGTPEFQIVYAKVVGEPLDPRRKYAPIVEQLCGVSTTEVGEDLFYFNTVEHVKYVYVIDASGNITQAPVTPASHSTAAFSDVITKEYYIPFTSLLSPKYNVLARTKVDVTRALDAHEIYLVLAIAWAGGSGNDFSLDTSVTKFKYPKLIEMLESIEDYGDNYIFEAGTTVMRDIRKWDYDENKYRSIYDMLKDFKLEIQRVSGASVTVDGDAKRLLDANKAILLARDNELGRKPIEFSRRKLDPIKILGGEIDTELQRAIIISPMPMPVAATRKPAISAWGAESIACVCVNTSAIARFTR